MAQRLTKIKLDEISLVDRPANPGAKVVIFKRDSGMPSKFGPLAKMLAASFAKAGNPDVDEAELTAAMEAAAAGDPPKDPPADPTKPVGDPPAGEDDPADDAVGKGDKAKQADEKDEKSWPKWMKDKMKKADEAIAENAELKKAQAEQVTKAAGLDTRLAKAEGELADMRRTGRIAKKALELSEAGVADAEAMAKVLDELPEAAAKQFEERLKKDAAALQNSDLFVAIGKGERELMPNSAEAEIDRLAKKESAEKKISYAEAYTDITKRDPVLRERVYHEREIAKRRAA